MFSKDINKDVLLITIAKSRKVLFSIRILWMLHNRFANATQVLKCEYN